MIKIFLQALLFFLLASPLRAEALTPAAAAQDPANDLAKVQQDLETSTENQARIIREMTQAIRDQEEASTKLVDLARTATAQEAALEQATTRLDKLKRDNAKALLALAAKREAMSKLLAGLQRLEQNPPPALVVAPDDVLSALRGAMMFGAVIPALRQETDELREALADVQAIKQALEAERERAAAALAALDETRRSMAALVAERQEAAARILQALAAERQKAEQLAARSGTLKELVAELEQQKAAEAERRQKEQAALEQARLEAEAARKKAEESLKRPAMVFSESRGRLDFPVQGEVWKAFGSDNGLDGRTQGVFLSSQAHAQVLSPVDGIVEFAGEFRSYDQVVIINPGEGYLVLLAGMAEITTEPGQSVRAGEPVGNMGEKPAPLQLDADLAKIDKPVLYVEFRKRNEPVDPAPWWADRKREAMR